MRLRRLNLWCRSDLRPGRSPRGRLHLRRPRRLLAGAAALVAVTMTASACDSSPYAATVNSTVIRQTALNAELRAWGANQAYVSAYREANSATNGGTGLTVGGDAPGTYNMTWVADTLTGIIVADALHQHLSATNQLPGSALLAAARSVSEVDHPGFWDAFTPTFRATLSYRLAEEAALTPPTSVSQTTLRGLYNQYQTFFFSQVCTLEASAFTRSAAQALSTAGVTHGSSVCYGQAQFENQSTAFQTEVRTLAVGATSAPIATSYGYQVLKVVSRAVQGFNPAVQSVLAAVDLIVNGQPNPAVIQVINATHVRVNPAYGTWKSSQVVPPPAPAAST